MSTKKLYVAGSLIIPIYFPANFTDRIESLQYVESILSCKTVSVIHADIHTWNGSSYPLVAKRCNIEWFEVVNKEEAN